MPTVPLHVKLSPAAHAGWHALARANGITVTAIAEWIGVEMGRLADDPDYQVDESVGGIRAALIDGARAIDDERRARRRDPAGQDQQPPAERGAR